MKVTRIAMKLYKPGPVVEEFLRYAGVVSVTGRDRNAPDPVVSKWLTSGLSSAPCFGDGDVLVTIQCPVGTNPQIWLEQNIGRLKSFTVPAVGYTESDLRKGTYSFHTGHYHTAKNFGCGRPTID